MATDAIGRPRRNRDSAHGDTEHRVFYIATFKEALYVLHAFEKKTRKTAQSDIQLGRDNLKELRKWRREQGL